MAENTQIQDAIEEAITKPRSFAADGMSKSAHSIPDLIAADKHVASKAATSSKNMGLRFGVFIPPGH
jgi:hypothetical protein